MNEPFRPGIEDVLDQLDGMPSEPEVTTAPMDRETLATPMAGGIRAAREIHETATTAGVA